MIVQFLEHSHNMIVSAACLALAELGKCGPLPLEDKTEDDKDTNNKLALVNKLLAMVKSNNTNMKIRERAALAAGSLCLGDNKFPHRN